MRVVLQSGYQPARTLQFIGYAGEEAGLLGSKEIAQSYAAQGRNVVGALQLDMTACPDCRHERRAATELGPPA